MRKIIFPISIGAILLLLIIGSVNVCSRNLFRLDVASAENSIKKMSNQQLNELKPVVKKLFTEYLESEEKPTVLAERRIKNFTVQNEIQLLKNDQTTYFIVTYDTLSASNEYVVAGGGKLNEDGWVRDRVIYVAIQMNDGDYQIKQLSAGP